MLGNGPSLADVDFSMLKDEYVFSVNFFHKNENWLEAHPNFHIWVDAAFFHQREDVFLSDETIRNSFEEMKKSSPLCFVPASAYRFLKSNGYTSDMDFYYLLTSGNIAEDIKNVDLVKNMPGYSNVVNYAIYIAIYMGFSEIYLLGVDGTTFLSYADIWLGRNRKKSHSYEEPTEEGNDRAEEIWNKGIVYGVLYGQYETFLGYRKLRDYCDAHGIIIRNLSSETIVSEIERMDISDVLKP